MRLLENWNTAPNLKEIGKDGVSDDFFFNSKQEFSYFLRPMSAR